MIVGVEVDGVNQVVEFCLIDLVVIIFVKNVESCLYDVQFFVGEL